VAHLPERQNGNWFIDTATKESFSGEKKTLRFEQRTLSEKKAERKGRAQLFCGLRAATSAGFFVLNTHQK
jgi:hypothetical protein